jgi:hypothetical protein
VAVKSSHKGSKDTKNNTKYDTIGYMLEGMAMAVEGREEK